MLALAPAAAAASYTDQMTGAASDDAAQYSGVEPYTLRGGIADSSVLTFASFSGATLRAHVDYSVEYAEAVTVSIYSPLGTFAVQGDLGAYLGVSNGTAYIPGQYLRQAMLHPGTGGVYTDLGGPGKLYNHDALANILRFKQVEALPEDLCGYGVAVSYSADGHSFAYAEMNHAGFEWLPELLCYERYTAAVPIWAKYIRVEINDVTEVEGQNRKDPLATRYTMLASVTISGENLRIGAAEEAAAISNTEVFVWGGVSRAETTSRAQSSPERSSGSEAPEKSAPSSKFEGTVTVSSKAQKEKSSPPPSSKSKSEAKSVSSSSQPPEEQPVNETAVYEIKRGETSGGMDTAVRAYIITVSGALTLAVLFRRR